MATATPQPAEEQHIYHAQDALALTSRYAVITGVVGAAASGMQSTLTRTNIGPMGFLTRFGGTAASFGTQLAL